MQLFNLVTQLESELRVNYDNPYQIFSLGKLLSDGLTLALLVAAMIVFACLVWGGYQWMTAGGEAGKIEAAKGRLTQCLVGFTILALSYTIAILVSYFFGIDVLQPLTKTEWSPPPIGGGPPAPPGPGGPGTPGETACGGQSECGTCFLCIAGTCRPNSGGSCSIGGCAGTCEDTTCVDAADTCAPDLNVCLPTCTEPLVCSGGVCVPGAEEPTPTISTSSCAEQCAGAGYAATLSRCTSIANASYLLDPYENRQWTYYHALLAADQWCEAQNPSNPRCICQEEAFDDCSSICVNQGYSDSSDCSASAVPPQGGYHESLGDDWCNTHFPSPSYCMCAP